MPTFAENLRRIRKTRGLTQPALSALSGLTQSAISRYEIGKEMPGLPSVLKLATGLKVTLEELTEGLDMRFDAVYRGLKVSITTDDPPLSDSDRQEPTGPESAPDELPLGQIVHGAPSESPRSLPKTTADMAAAVKNQRAHIEDLRATIAHLISITGNIAAGSAAVASGLGPEVRPGDTRAGHRTRPRTQKGAKGKRLKRPPRGGA